MTLYLQYDKLLNEKNINELNELKNTDFNLSKEFQKKLLNQNIKNNNVESSIWLIDNVDMNDLQIHPLDLFEFSIKIGNVGIARHIYHKFNIELLLLNNKYVTKLKNRQCKIFINQLIQEERKNINVEFIKLCNICDIQKMDKYYQLYNKYIDKNKIMQHTNKTIKYELIVWLFDHQFIKEYNNIIKKCVNFLETFESLYIIFPVMINKYDFIPHKEPFNQYIKDELIYEEFLTLVGNDSHQAKDYYMNHMETIIFYVLRNDSYDKLLNIAYDNNKDILWLIKLFNIQYDTYNTYYLKSIEDGNVRMFNLLYEFIKKQHMQVHHYVKSVYIDDAIYTAICHNTDNDEIMAKLQIYNTDTYMKIALENDNINYIKKIDKYFHILNDQELFGNLLYDSCRNGALKILKYTYSKNKIFTDGYDELYEATFYMSMHIAVLHGTSMARWLAGLFDRFKVIDQHTFEDTVYYSDDSSEWTSSEYDSDEDYYSDNEHHEDCVHCQTEHQDEIVKSIIFEMIKNDKSKAYTLFGIKETIVDPDATCVICYDKPNSLIRLPCGHDHCVDCVCNWYHKNKDLCTYCKQHIHWFLCKKVNRK